MPDVTTGTDNTDPGGTLVLTAEDRDHLGSVLRSDIQALESLLRTEYSQRNHGAEYEARLAADHRLIQQLDALAA